MITTGSSDTRPFSRWFQIRWAERLGDPEHPYLVRWTFIFLGFSLRIHHWLRSDDNRFFHDHSSDLISIVLRGYYFNVTPYCPEYPPSYVTFWKRNRALEFRSTDGKARFMRFDTGNNRNYHFVEGMFNSLRNLRNFKRSIWFSKAEDRHYLDIPEGGAWTLLLEGRKRHDWGFYVPRMDKHHRSEDKVRRMRPLKYFKKYGILQANPHYQ